MHCAGHLSNNPEFRFATVIHYTRIAGKFQVCSAVSLFFSCLARLQGPIAHQFERICVKLPASNYDQQTDELGTFLPEPFSSMNMFQLGIVRHI